MKHHTLHPASHCPLIVLSRSDGRSSVAAAAYAARTRMTDQRTGRVHNYGSVGGLLAEGVVNWSGSAEDLWNTVERSETRSNARVARELRPALPAELPLADQRRLVHGMSCWLKDEFGVAVHYVIHAPRFHEASVDKAMSNNRETEAGEVAYLAALSDPEMTNLNFHAHIRLTTRTVDGSGGFGDKTRELDAKKTGAACVLAIRREWERRTNAALKKIGATSHVDLRSYADMAEAGDAPDGLEAQRHRGPKASARDRRASRETGGNTPANGAEREATKLFNDILWRAWELERARAREISRLNGDSERIAAERELLRRQEAAARAERIRAAESPGHAAKAAEDARSVDAVRPRDGWLEAVQDVFAGHAPDRSPPEFDEVIDPETYDMPHQTRPDRADVRIRVKARGPRQRTRGG